MDLTHHQMFSDVATFQTMNNFIALLIGYYIHCFKCRLLTGYYYMQLVASSAAAASTEQAAYRFSF